MDLHRGVFLKAPEKVLLRAVTSRRTLIGSPKNFSVHNTLNHFPPQMIPPHNLGAGTLCSIFFMFKEFLSDAALWDLLWSLSPQRNESKESKAQFT